MIITYKMRHVIYIFFIALALQADSVFHLFSIQLVVQTTMTQ